MHGKDPKELIALGKATQFGQERGADPSKANAAGVQPKKERASVRRQSRVIARMSVSEVKDLMANIDDLSVAQAVAIAKFKKAMTGDVKAMESFTVDVDGKPVETRVQATMTLADLVNGSLEYDDEYAQSSEENSPVET